MSSRPRKVEEGPAFGRDPLSEDEEILAATFYASDSVRPAPSTGRRGSRTGRSGARSSPKAASTPDHYRILSISLYTEDIEKLDSMVEELKRRGHTKASRSALIRYALDTVDVTKMPRGY